MVRTSESTAGLMEALATAQGNFGAAIRGNVNPAFRSKYADLSAVIDATLEHLNKAGVVVMQHPSLEYKGDGESREAFVTVTTRLQFKGEWLESEIAIPAVQRDRFDAQSVGSAITYGCRYALQSILVVPREDDDANAASGRGTSEAAQAVGQEKIAKLKQKMAEGSNGNGKTGASLFYALQPSGSYAVTGDVDLMRRIYQQFKNSLHDDKEGKFYMLNDEQLNVLQFQCTEGNIPLKQLKGPNA